MRMIDLLTGAINGLTLEEIETLIAGLRAIHNAAWSKLNIADKAECQAQVLSPTVLSAQFSVETDISEPMVERTSRRVMTVRFRVDNDDLPWMEDAKAVETIRSSSVVFQAAAEAKEE